MASEKTKEQIYDEQIAPLMTQVLSICQRHGIATLCTFDLPNGTDSNLSAICILPDGSGENPVHHKKALREIGLL